MQQLGATEDIRVSGLSRTVFLQQENADPTIGTVSLKAATSALKEALRHLPELAREREQPDAAPRTLLSRLMRGLPKQQEWTLALDELEDAGEDVRTRLPLRGEHGLAGPRRALARGADSLSEIVLPLELDPLAMADDATFFSRIDKRIKLA